MPAAARSWATPDAVREKVRRRWADGTLLRAVARGEELSGGTRSPRTP